MAARTLGKIKDNRAIEPLIKVLNYKHRDYRVTQATTWALKNITGKDFGNDYTQWQKWWQENKDQPPSP